MKKCPHCGLLNPDSAQKCDCGYGFGAPVDKVFIADALRRSENASKRVQAEDAKKYVRRSWIAASAPAILWILIVWADMEPWALPIHFVVAAYIGWALYWGLHWASGYAEYVNSRILWFFIILLVGSGPLLLPPLAYGLLGGGIYQHLKHRRIAKAFLQGQTPRQSRMLDL